MNRQKFLSIALALFLATLLTQPTVSYYTVSGIARNVVTSGAISCEIVEMMGDEEFPAEGVYIMPGSIVSKAVTVRNTGEHPFWLRVKLINGINSEALSADMLELDINREDWIESAGYYYYRCPLEAGEETSRLFSEVKIAGTMDNSYLGKEITLTVCAFAVQSENNAPDSPLKVSGWPAES